LEKESGHSTTRPRGATPVSGGVRRPNQDVNGSSAKAGISRSGAIPPIRFTSGAQRDRLIRLTSRGASAASLDHIGSHPME
jgi:hypothetical protein